MSIEKPEKPEKLDKLNTLTMSERNIADYKEVSEEVDIEVGALITTVDYQNDELEIVGNEYGIVIYTVADEVRVHMFNGETLYLPIDSIRPTKEYFASKENMADELIDTLLSVLQKNKLVDTNVYFNAYFILEFISDGKINKESVVNLLDELIDSLFDDKLVEFTFVMLMRLKIIVDSINEEPEEPEEHEEHEEHEEPEEDDICTGKEPEPKLCKISYNKGYHEGTLNKVEACKQEFNRGYDLGRRVSAKNARKQVNKGVTNLNEDVKNIILNDIIEVLNRYFK